MKQPLKLQNLLKSQGRLERGERGKLVVSEYKRYAFEILILGIVFFYESICRIIL